jgi:hypothetical protein
MWVLLALLVRKEPKDKKALLVLKALLVRKELRVQLVHKAL